MKTSFRMTSSRTNVTNSCLDSSALQWYVTYSWDLGITMVQVAVHIYNVIKLGIAIIIFLPL